MIGDLEGRLRSYFEESSDGAAAAYLFGSAARGSARAASDVDVAVLFERPPARTLEGMPTGLQNDLEQLTGRHVDLVVLNDAPPDLVHRVLRDGVLLAERNRSMRIRFEVRSRNEYFDLLPVLEEYRRPRGSDADRARP